MADLYTVYRSQRHAELNSQASTGGAQPPGLGGDGSSDCLYDGHIGITVYMPII